MSKDPVLATFGEPLPGHPYRVRDGMIVKGGLHHIKGNSAPYFSLTCDIYERGRDVGGGAAHDEILRKAPHLKPLADLHLSSIDGVPMHAAANGWYWMAGTVAGGFGQKYHGGTGSGAKDAAECLRIFAKLVRISLQEAADLRERLIAETHTVNQYDRVYLGAGNAKARALFDCWIEEQKPRWKADADACIKALDLKVYGDPWVRAEV